MKSFIGFFIDLIVFTAMLFIIDWLFGRTATNIAMIVYLCIVAFSVITLIYFYGFKEAMKYCWKLQANSWYLVRIERLINKLS